MSVTTRPYVNGGWEVDICVELPDGTDIRERKKAPSLSNTAAQRWAQARERVLLVEGKPNDFCVKCCRTQVHVALRRRLLLETGIESRGGILEAAGN